MERAAASLLCANDKQKVGRENAARLFGLSAPSAAGFEKLFPVCSPSRFHVNTR
jgi:hypothetical protein